MEPLNAFCLAALVFLSLPLPLFASTALSACPSARRLLLPWVWGNTIMGSVLGLLIIATPMPPLAVLAVGGTVFMICGMEMFRCLAQVAGGASTRQTTAGQRR